jgi:hypothetical protein
MDHVEDSDDGSISYGSYAFHLHRSSISSHPPVINLGMTMISLWPRVFLQAQPSRNRFPAAFPLQQYNPFVSEDDYSDIDSFTIAEMQESEIAQHDAEADSGGEDAQSSGFFSAIVQYVQRWGGSLMGWQPALASDGHAATSNIVDINLTARQSYRHVRFSSTESDEVLFAQPDWLNNIRSPRPRYMPARSAEVPSLTPEYRSPNALALESRKFPQYSIPDHMLCQISFEIATDPVYAKIAPEIIYDRKNIEQWLLTKHTHPHTGTALCKEELIPHDGLRKAINRFMFHTTPENSAISLQRFFRARREFRKLRQAAVATLTPPQEFALNKGMKLFQIRNMNGIQLYGLEMGLTHEQVLHPDYDVNVADLVDQGFRFADVISLTKTMRQKVLDDYEIFLGKNNLKLKGVTMRPFFGLTKEQCRHPNFTPTVSILLRHGFKYKHAIELNPGHQQKILSKYESIRAGSHLNLR